MSVRGVEGVKAGTPEPENWNENWQFFPVGTFAPLYQMKESPEYWRGYDARWCDLEEAVKRGFRPAVLVERSGLVIIDCDVEADFKSITSSSVVFGDLFRYGSDDLSRLCREREKELPATFTVSTPSGGEHLYFRQNPHCPVTSHGHRKNWLIDVKASVNSWVVAPPTPGYAVTRDLPVAVLPYWLARHVRRLGMESRTRPRTSGGPVSGPAREGILRFVAESNVNGSWNNSIYWAAHRFIEAGEALEDITAALLEAAAPRDEREAEKARRTIESAWRNARESK